MTNKNKKGKNRGKKKEDDSTSRSQPGKANDRKSRTQVPRTNQSTKRSEQQNTTPRVRRPFNAFRGMSYNNIKINYADYESSTYQNMVQETTVPPTPTVNTNRRRSPNQNKSFKKRNTQAAPHQGLGFSLSNFGEGPKLSETDVGRWFKPVKFVKSTLEEDMLLMKITYKKELEGLDTFYGGTHSF
jgi:hypothetical protein